MKKTLVILAHNNYEHSVANKTIISSLLEKADGSDIEVRHIFELYRDYKIDAIAEQAALLRADNIVLQFPLYWYNIPAIGKAWLDEVLQYGFAYGTGGDKLRGKNLLLSVTTGAPAEAYTAPLDIHAVLAPFQKSSNFIQTNFVAPVYSHGMHSTPNGDNTDVINKAKNHAQQLYTTLASL